MEKYLFRVTGTCHQAGSLGVPMHFKAWTVATDEEAAKTDVIYKLNAAGYERVLPKKATRTDNLGIEYIGYNEERVS